VGRARPRELLEYLDALARRAHGSGYKADWDAIRAFAAEHWDARVDVDTAVRTVSKIKRHPKKR
jgi:hypothetical protein